MGEMEFANSDSPFDSVYTAVSNSGLVGGMLQISNPFTGESDLSRQHFGELRENNNYLQLLFRVMDANALE